MFQPNLPKTGGNKSPYSIRLYDELLSKFDTLEAKTGIRSQDIIRTALNDFLDRSEVKSLL